jgi:tetrahydromethanopterin:alpha-L-glutamate ligase
MRIGVFGNLDSWYVHTICGVGEERGHSMHPLQFDRFRSVINDGHATWYSGDVCLNRMDAILVRTMPPGTLEQVVARMDLLAGLESAGIPIVNSPRSLECAVDKYLTTQRLCQSGLPIPQTVVCESADEALEAFDALGNDVVIKPLFGAEGRGIIRVSDPELALRAFRTLERLGAVLYIQQFLSGDGGDIRILLLDGAVLGAMKRTARPGEFRANMALQGSAVPYAPSDLETKLSERACRAVGCIFAGVDLMYDHTGQPTVIEVNAVPGWKGLQRVCGVDVPGHLLRWLERSLQTEQSFLKDTQRE